MKLNIGKKICELRKTHGLTQEQLASEMGVSIAAVSKWETGNSLPDVLMLCSIADYFVVSTDELLGRTKGKKTVIIADDSDFLRKTLKGLLEENNIDVVAEATNGKELMNILKTKRTDIVILDINMPVMDGIEALKHIKTEHPNVKVIMCSVTNDNSIIDEAIALGACGYIVKPFMPEAIIGCLSRT